MTKEEKLSHEKMLHSLEDDSINLNEGTNDVILVPMKSHNNDDAVPVEAPLDENDYKITIKRSKTDEMRRKEKSMTTINETSLEGDKGKTDKKKNIGRIQARSSVGDRLVDKTGRDIRLVKPASESDARPSLQDYRIANPLVFGPNDVDVSPATARASVLSHVAYQHARPSTLSMGGGPESHDHKVSFVAGTKDHSKKDSEWKRVAENWWQKPRYLLNESHGVEVKAGWTELFYDLLFVAACIELGNQLKTDISFTGYLQFFLYFSSFWWTWHVANHYYSRFVTDDYFHEYLIFFHMVGVLGMAIHIGPDIGFGNKTRYAISYMISRAAIICMYTFVFIFIKKARRTSALVILSNSVSCVLWLGSIWASDTVTAVLWALGIVIEIFFAMYPIKEKHRLHAHSGYTAERQGLFVMLVLGESVISLVLPPFNDSVSYYLVVFFGFWLVFNLELNFFDTMPSEHSDEGIDDEAFSGVRGKIVQLCHLLLSASLILVGVGLKLAVTYADSYLLYKYQYTLAIGVGASLWFMQIIRIANQDGFHGSYFFKSWDRRILFLLRLIIPAIAISLPVMDALNPSEFVIVLFVLSLIYVTLDTYGHHRYRHQQQAFLLKDADLAKYEIDENPPIVLEAFYDYDPLEVNLWMKNDVQVCEDSLSQVLDLSIDGEKLLMAQASEILIVFGNEDGAKIILNIARICNGGDMALRRRRSVRRNTGQNPSSNESL